MFSFFRSQPVILCLEITDATLRGAVVKAKDRGAEVLEKAEEAFPEGSVKGGMIDNPQLAGETLAHLLKKFTHASKKMPAAVSVSPALTYTAFIEGLAAMPRNKTLLTDLTTQWLPFSQDEILVKHLWYAGAAPALTMTALEMKLVRGYRTMLAKTELGTALFIPRTYGLMIAAFGKLGPEHPSILLDLTAQTPVMTLCAGTSIIDERVLFGSAPNDAYCETILTWVPRVLGTGTVTTAPKTAKELKREEKEREKEAKRKAKEEAKAAKARAKAASKGGSPEVPKSVTANVNDEKLTINQPAIATLDMDKQHVVPITIFGDESHPFDVSCRKLVNLSVVTQYQKLEDPAFSFAHALGAAYPVIHTLPAFS